MYTLWPVRADRIDRGRHHQSMTPSTGEYKVQLYASKKRRNKSVKIKIKNSESSTTERRILLHRKNPRLNSPTVNTFDHGARHLSITKRIGLRLQR